eukprot:3271970-Rhodomonas_salina.3
MPVSSEAKSVIDELCEAAKCGNTEDLRRLLALENVAAEVNSGNHSANRYTPLHYGITQASDSVLYPFSSSAAWNGMGVSAGLLIEAKANADAGDAYGRTPMHLAARMGHSAVVAVLALANAQVNAKQESRADDFAAPNFLQLGATPLHYAAMEGHAGTCQKLVKLGADVAAENDAGSTALELAVCQPRTRCLLASSVLFTLPPPRRSLLRCVCFIGGQGSRQGDYVSETCCQKESEPAIAPRERTVKWNRLLCLYFYSLKGKLKDPRHTRSARQESQRGCVFVQHQPKTIEENRAEDCDLGSLLDMVFLPCDRSLSEPCQRKAFK